jgi:DNA helicase-2/ATP-dependent DNA helicase PcrA
MNASDTLVNVDDEIFSCLNLDSPKSFFLFAGAGSGKTRSLVELLKRFQKNHINRLRLNGQKIAIITYTNAACDEIKRRLEFDSTFVISTIHSFAWELICPFQRDIKDWIRLDTNKEILELEEKQLKGHAGTKAASDRAAKIESKKERLADLEKIKCFSYNPNASKSGQASLNHAEVIKISAFFLTEKPLMQQILVKKYPILLIDESQDTKKELIDAFFGIQGKYSNIFSLGLFGDDMQRIYMDGKPDLGSNIPASWMKPAKLENYRCPKRVITLINKIRSEADGQEQKPSTSNEDGIVRLFIVDSNSEVDKPEMEKKVAQKMSELTGDALWRDFETKVKTLTLEHLMAARRSGFIDFFEPLYKSSGDSTGLLNGTMHGISFFTQQLLPLIKAKQSGDQFGVAQIVKKYSPLMDNKMLKECKDSMEQIRKANSAVESLFSLWKDESEPTLLEVIKKTSELELFSLPEYLHIIAKRSNETFENVATEDEHDNLIDAWDEALKSPFKQLVKYADYISDNSTFGTHQGVKGLEFPRVMVIVDDEEAKGFLFSYEKLFGGKSLTSEDQKKIKAGEEISIDRTRRLFYVTCSRAEKSLAIVAYTKAPNDVKNFVVSKGWFVEDEVVVEL